MVANLNVTKLGTAKVIVDIVKKGNVEIRPGYSMKPTHITIHNTGNNGRGANAKAHNTYIHNMAKLTPKDTGYASWHFSVDATTIYQHLPLNETAWHCGDGTGKTSGNMTSIGIEICEDPGTNTKQAEENAIALAVFLMKALGISVNNVKPHQAWSGKYCPRVILGRDGSFTKFHNRIKAAYNVKTGVAATPKPKQLVGKITADIWTQKNAVFSATGRVKVLKKDSTWKIHGEKNGYYDLGSEWVNKNYVRLV